MMKRPSSKEEGWEKIVVQVSKGWRKVFFVLMSLHVDENHRKSFVIGNSHIDICRYRVKFFDLQEPDAITMSWIQESKTKSSQLWLQIWHIVAKLFLKIFLTQTCCNGLLRRGSMYILSENVRMLNFS
jgi:hypothetical protein